MAGRTEGGEACGASTSHPPALYVAFDVQAAAGQIILFHPVGMAYSIFTAIH